MAKAWTYQDDKQVKKRGEAKASWYVGWLDPAGKRRCKSCWPGAEGKRLAEKEADKIHAQLVTGTYESNSRKTWPDFRRQYDADILPGLAERTREEVAAALGHFERLGKPGKVDALTTAKIDSFVASRRREPGKKRGSTVSPSTINKELRHLRSALAVAAEWGFLTKQPKFRMEKTSKKLVVYVTPEHFAAMYAACDVATRPADVPNVVPADWWRALIVTAYMTGWRISELLSLRRDDLDLEAGVAITRGKDNKGKRDEAVKLHPVAVEHLRKVVTFGPVVLPYHHYKTTLYEDFAAIQEHAGIKLNCPHKHEHTRFCYVYGFHDLRRAFATMNAARLTPDALQTLMRHKSYSTTQLYISMSRQTDAAVDSLHVPDVLKPKRQPGS